MAFAVFRIVRISPIADVRPRHQTAIMNGQPNSSFTEEELAFLESVAEMLPEDRADALRRDVEVAVVRRDGDFICVDLPGYERPKHPTQRGLPFEGRMYDADGGAMNLFVNMDSNDRLLELEFVWWENASSVAPDWSTLRIVPEAPMGVSQW